MERLAKVEEKIKANKQALSNRYKIKKIGIFGSYAHGHPTKHSDIDFLVEFKKGADLLDQIGLKLKLEALLHTEVDVVTPAALSRYFRDKVLKETVYL